MTTVWILMIFYIVPRDSGYTTIPVQFSTVTECKDAFEDIKKSIVEDAGKNWFSWNVNYTHVCVPIKINKE